MKKLSTRISIAALGLVGTTGGAFAQDVALRFQRIAFSF